MRFRPYPKIPLRPESSPGGPWVATEKIHGANFAIGLAPSGVRFGKRKAWLEADSPFFGWQLLAAELEDRVRALGRSLGAARLFAYGELFGGAYPHPGVPPWPGLSAVQTGVWYHPGLRWALFDVLVLTDDEEAGIWLSFPELLEASEAAGLFTAPVLGRGRRDALEQLPVAFSSRVATALGLPPLQGNVAEGLVLKPERGGAARPILKKKIPEFSEARFDEAEPPAPGPADPGTLLFWAEKLMNPARWASARSKVGVDDAAIRDEVALDVLLDLHALFPGSPGLSDGEELLRRVRALADRADPG